MSRRIAATFIGPVTREGGGAFFEVLSVHGGVIRLDYVSPQAAKDARAALAKADTAYKVPNQILFSAIQELANEKASPAQQPERKDYATPDGY